MKSKIYKLNANDFLQGLILTILFAVLTFIYDAINKCGIECVDWRLLCEYSVKVFLGYILKNYFRNSKGKYFSAEGEKNV